MQSATASSKQSTDMLCCDQNEKSMHDKSDLGVIFPKEQKRQMIAYCISVLPITADANAGIKGIINYL